MAEVATHGSTVVLHAAGIVGGLSSADMMSMMISLVFESQVKSASSNTASTDVFTANDQVFRGQHCHTTCV